MEYAFEYEFPIGKLKIVENDGYISTIAPACGKICNKKETPLIKEAKKQLDEYFSGKRKKFNLPVKIEGTEFQKAVYQGLLGISYGKTKSYKEIADIIGHKNAYRAVGSTCNKNKILIIVPCHRVIASNKSLAGFALGLDIKKQLLKIEGVEF